jgi:hypothetical protein
VYEGRRCTASTTTWPAQLLVSQVRFLPRSSRSAAPGKACRVHSGIVKEFRVVRAWHLIAAEACHLKLRCVTPAGCTTGKVSSIGRPSAVPFPHDWLNHTNPMNQPRQTHIVWAIRHNTVLSWRAADANLLIDECRVTAQRYTATYQEPMPCEQLVRHVCDVKQAYTQTGGQRPFGVSILYAGWCVPLPRSCTASCAQPAASEHGLHLPSLRQRFTFRGTSLLFVGSHPQ